MIEKDLLLSIIVPVYNVEKYIERCMDSLLSEHLEDCEVLLIDDGSTDASGKLCDQYRKNKRVSVVHKKNGGLSDARNIGIDNSKGRYLFFVDSDDLIERGSIEIIKEELIKTNCDILIFKSKLLYETGKTEDELTYKIKEGLYSSSEYMEQLKKHPQSVLFCAPYHICKREIIDNNGIRFEKGILHEDELWTPQLLIVAKSIRFIDAFCYYHFVREGSIMNSSNLEKSGYSDVFVTNKLLEIFNSSRRSDLQYMRDHMVTTYLQAVWKIPSFFHNRKTFSRIMPLQNAYYLKTRVKSCLFFLSPKLYCIIHKIITQS